MKSIIEQASTISKAIEQCWERAGRPQEFSVKVLEEPETKLLFFNKKPAKVALFYEEKRSNTHVRNTREHKHSAEHSKKQSLLSSGGNSATALSQKQGGEPKQANKKQNGTAAPVARQHGVKSKQDTPAGSALKVAKQSAAPKGKQITHDTSSVAVQEGPSRAENQSPWNDELISMATVYLTDMLNIMEVGNIGLSHEVVGQKLKITFSSAPIADSSLLKPFFTNCAHMVMEILRSKTNKSLRNMHIVFLVAENV